MLRNAFVYPHTLSPFVRRWVLSSFFFCVIHSFFFSRNRSISSPFRRVLSLLAFSNTILRAHNNMLTLFTIYSFAVFQIDLLYALRYNSLQRHFNNNNLILKKKIFAIVTQRILLYVIDRMQFVNIILALILVLE